eukprot:TRINITY_DN9916_c0_g1_i2.p1 TRINITY_DN9916_c0_g1~~TRINITY_DN9916_c0_g1_i2.p1  ORF type:complete len:746 (+),score=130.56 TRINITY_DN9916_c0_g1_i2:42-2240(+)
MDKQSHIPRAPPQVAKTASSEIEQMHRNVPGAAYTQDSIDDLRTLARGKCNRYAQTLPMERQLLEERGIQTSPLLSSYFLPEIATSSINSIPFAPPLVGEAAEQYEIRDTSILLRDHIQVPAIDSAPLTEISQVLRDTPREVRSLPATSAPGSAFAVVRPPPIPYADWNTDSSATQPPSASTGSQISFAVHMQPMHQSTPFYQRQQQPPFITVAPTVAPMIAANRTPMPTSRVQAARDEKQRFDFGPMRLAERLDAATPIATAMAKRLASTFIPPQARTFDLLPAAAANAVRPSANSITWKVTAHSASSGNAAAKVVLPVSDTGLRAANSTMPKVMPPISSTLLNVAPVSSGHSMLKAAFPVSDTGVKAANSTLVNPLLPPASHSTQRGAFSASGTSLKSAPPAVNTVSSLPPASSAVPKPSPAPVRSKAVSSAGAAFTELPDSAIAEMSTSEYINYMRRMRDQLIDELQQVSDAEEMLHESRSRNTATSDFERSWSAACKPVSAVTASAVTVSAVTGSAVAAPVTSSQFSLDLLPTLTTPLSTHARKYTLKDSPTSERQQWPLTDALLSARVDYKLVPESTSTSAGDSEDLSQWELELQQRVDAELAVRRGADMLLQNADNQRVFCCVEDDADNPTLSISGRASVLLTGATVVAGNSFASFSVCDKRGARFDLQTLPGESRDVWVRGLSRYARKQQGQQVAMGQVYLEPQKPAGGPQLAFRKRRGSASSRH